MSNRTRGLPVLAPLLCLTLVAACSAPSDDQATKTDPTQGSQAASATPKDFVVVINGDALAAHQLDYMAAQGAREAKESGASGNLVVSHSFEPLVGLQQAAAAHPRLVLGTYLDPATLLDIARRNPHTDFVALDNDLQDPPSNVTATRIDTHQSSYLAGVVAATMSRTHHVGAVLGAHKPVIDQFLYGYKQGVLDTCPQCRVQAEYLDNQFINPSAGAEAAKRLFRDGADIVFAVAGLAGTGALQQAQRQHRYAIGVDGIQEALFPRTVIASVVKRVDVLVTRMINAQHAGRFPGGRANDGGLAAGLSDLSWNLGSHTFAHHAPPNLQAPLRLAQSRVAKTRKAILSGKVHVCDALNNPASRTCKALGLRVH